MKPLCYFILCLIALLVFLCGCAGPTAWTDDHGRIGNAWVALTEPR